MRALCIVVCLFGLFSVALSQNSGVGYGSANYVIVLGCDGMGGDYLRQANNTPNFDSLMAQGSSTYNARNSWPTVSLPNWSAIINGGGPEDTGVDGNGWYQTSNCLPYGSVYSPECLECYLCETVATGILVSFEYLPRVQNLTRDLLNFYVREKCREVPLNQHAACIEIGEAIVEEIVTGQLGAFTNANEVCVDLGLCAGFLRPIVGAMLPSMFQVAKQAKPGIHTACFTDWTGINQIVEPGLVDYFRFANAGPPYRSSIIVEELINVIQEHTPELVFIHFDDIDETGHENGWGSPAYYEAISLVDYEVGLLLDAYEAAGILEETLVLTIADHGGQKAGHGFTDQLNTEIPWIATGPGVLSNYQISSYTRNMDIPATVLYALGIPQPVVWESRPATEIWSGIPYSSPQAPSSGLASGVVTLIISGLNQQGFQLVSTPNLHSLIKNGSYYAFARSQMPSTTLPNVASIIMGAGPEETGICVGPFPAAGSCEWSPEGSPVPPISGVGSLFPSIYQVLSQNGVSNTAAVYQFQNISQVLANWTTSYQETSDANVASTVSQLLKSGSPPKYTMAQFYSVQQAGLTYGYESDEYLTAIASVDQTVQTIVNALPSNYILVICSDNGGYQTQNGDTNNQSLLAPFIVYGPGVVKSKYRISSTTKNYDAASISLYSLGYQQPTYWIGNPHPEIFQ